MVNWKTVLLLKTEARCKSTLNFSLFSFYKFEIRSKCVELLMGERHVGQSSQKMFPSPYLILLYNVYKLHYNISVVSNA